MNKKKAGFTLAEVMVVFTVIGVLAAILIPTLLNTSPSHGKLRARKAYNTFVRATELLINGPYASNSPESALAAAPFISTSVTNYQAARRRYFCNQLAQVLNVDTYDCTKTGLTGTMKTNVNQVSCSDDDYSLCLSNSGSETGTIQSRYTLVENALDTACAGATTASYYQFKTKDGIFWSIAGNDFSNARKTTGDDGLKEYISYGLVCACTVGGNDPSKCTSEYIYGMGIRRDGKIIAGIKMQEVLNDTSTED